MSELPQGWCRTPLQEVIDFSIGGIWGDAPQNASPDSNPVTVVRGADYRNWATDRASRAAIRSVSIRAAASRQLLEGDIVVEVSGGGPTQPVGRVVLIDKTALVSSNLPLVPSNFCRRMVVSKHVVPAFLHLQLHYKYKSGGTETLQTSSTNIRNLNFNRYLAETGIGVAPYAEQERIVAATEEQFSHLDAAVAALSKAERGLSRIRSSILESAVNGRLLGVDNSGWELHSLGDVLVGIEAGKSFKCAERNAVDDEWGVVKVSAMTWGEFRDGEHKTVLETDKVDPRWEIHPGDLLVSRANTVDYVGAVVHVKRTRPRLLLSDKSLRLHPGPGVMPEWLVIALRARHARRYIETVATGSSDSMRNISQEKLRRTPVPIPPINRQHELVAEVDRLNSEVEAQSTVLMRSVTQSHKLHQSILGAAFSGKLVSQDPSDEPAWLLLQRIAAERPPVSTPRIRKPYTTARQRARI